MRFEVAAAFALGILLPLLETGRRGIGHWKIDFTTMFEDYFAGAILLIAAFATQLDRRWGPLFPVVAWSGLTGMMTMSLISQVEDTLRGSVAEPYNPLVIIVKLLLWATCLFSLVLSFRRVQANELR